jgi:hypothetical protein
MADSPDTVGSWPGLVAQLNKTFMLIRDVFGYALPGAVFLAIGLISKRFSLIDLQNLLHPYQPPAWVVFLLLIGACYAVGDVLASTAYMPIALLKRWQWRTNSSSTQKQLLKENPTEVNGELLEIRRQHPEFFLESDRRETLMLLGGSMAAALLGGYVAFYFLKLSSGALFATAGVIMLIQFSTGPSHLRRVQAAIREANTGATAATSKTPPDFPQLLADLITATTKALKKYAP